jgi:trimethylamine-N-oxide reductase (cytochrome c)
MISWQDFLKKGYYVIPPGAPATQAPVDMRWFAEGQAKDVPEPIPLPGQYADEFGHGLPTQSGQFEFVPQSLKRFEAQDADRAAVNRYIPAWEGGRAAANPRLPLQLITGHPRYSFHTYADGKQSAVSDIRDHRVTIGGVAYWIVRISEPDAAARGIAHHDLVKVCNARGAVLCAADVTATLLPGVLGAYESSANYELIETPEGPVDRGGCLNLLTPPRTMTSTADGIAPNSCLVEVQKWIHPMRAAS